MANRIAGITVEIGGDTTKLSTALKSVNQEIRSTQQQLKDVNSLLKLDPSNTELLAQKHKLLKDAIKETKEKLDALKDAAEKANEKLKSGEITQAQYDALQREIVETEEKLKGLESQAGKSEVALQKIAAVGDKMKEAGDKISGVGTTLTKTVTAPVVGIGAAAIKLTADFDASMSKVKAISGATGEDFDKLRAKAREMGESTKFTATDAAEAMNYMAMAGWKTGDMLDGIEGIMNLAAASGEDLATTSDIVTDALTAFGMEASESGRLADILASAAANANTNVGMMGQSFKYVAPVAGAMGYQAEDVAVALGLMANSGIKADMAGTSLRNMMQRMAKPTKESAEAMERLGISIDDGNGHMYSFKEIMDQLRESYTEINMPLEEYNARLDELDAGLEDGTLKQNQYDKELEELNLQAFGAEGAEKARAAAMLGGTRAMAGLLAITEASQEDYDKLTESIYGSSGAAEEMANIMQDNASGQWQIFISKVQELAISFGDIMMPIIMELIEYLQGLMDKLNQLSPEQQEMIVKIGLIVAALGPVLIVVGKVISAIGSIMSILPQLGGLMTTIGGGLSTLGGAFQALWGVIIANPIALIIAAIIALVALIATKGDEIQGLLQKVDDFLQNIFAKDWTEVFGPVLGGIINNFMQTVKGLWDSLKTILDGIIDLIRGVFTGDWERAWKGVKEIFKGVFDGLVAIAKIPLNGIIGLLNMAIGAVNKLVDGFNSIGFNMPDWLGGGSWHPNIPHIPSIPMLAQGGILTQGSAIVGEAGAELLSVRNGQAIVQPLGGQNNTSELNALLKTYLPYLAMKQSIMLDGDTLVGETATRMNDAINTIKVRNAKR